MLIRMSSQVGWKRILIVAETVDIVKVAVGVSWEYIYKITKRSRQKRFGINLFALAEMSEQKYS